MIARTARSAAALFFTIALITAAARMAPAIAQPVELSDEEAVARTLAVVEWAMARPGAVALSVAVARGGEVLFEQGVGIADLELDVPANRETSFRIGSVTKQFTAAAIMKLVERETLSLDDDIRDYLPQFDTGGRAVTIRQLLNHTSGVPSYTSQPDFFPKGSPVNLTHEELLAYVEDVPFDFEPSEGWNYSNTGYYLLGMIIEAAAERPYAQFVEEELFEPLGLTRTRYGSEREIIPNRAQGYEFDAATGRLYNDALISMNTPVALTAAEPPPLPELRTTANPGSAAAVRRMLEEIARGEPDYGRLSPQLAEATRAQLPAMQQMLSALGSIESITFLSAGPAGQDIYDVRLENGSLVFQIMLDAEGRTVGAGISPGARPAE